MNIDDLSADMEERAVHAWWIVADVRTAMAEEFLAGAPGWWTDCVRSHLERIDELRAELDEQGGIAGSEAGER